MTVNLLDALKAHLTTGEVPESLRETLGGGVRTSTVVPGGAHPQPTSPVAHTPARPSAPGVRPGGTSGLAPRPSRGPVRSGSPSRKLSIDELEESHALPATGPRVGGDDLADLARPQAPPEAVGLVPARTTPAGELEPALPDPESPRPEEPNWVHQVNFLSNACEKCGRGPAERKATPVCDGEPKRGLNRATEHRLAKADYVERAQQIPHLTTDETLEADLRGSLVATAKPAVKHHPTCRADYPEKVEGEAAQQLTKVDLEDGTGEYVWQCVDCGAHSDVVVEDPAAEATLGVLSSQPAPTFEIPVDLADLPLFAYVCGAAGVGKTWWAKEVARRGGDAVMLAATTGIASVNLGEGTTINSALKFYDTASLRESYTGGYLEAMLKKHRATGLERILLDEVSMMAAEQLTILTRAIDNVNQDKPEGVPDMGLILLGDFAQLAPVPDRDPSDPKGFKKLPVEFAFESHEWERYEANTFKLQTIRRQADAEFIGALQACRRGAVGEAMAYFGPRMVQTTDMNFPGPTIVAKNDAVGKFNQLRLDQVKGAKVPFSSSRWGKVRPEWGADPKPKHEWGVPEILQLKEGCRVMILANKNVGGKDEPPVWAYTNGDLGTFKQEDQGVAVVTLDRTGTDVRVGPLNRYNEIPMEPGRRKALKAEGKPERISDDGKREYIGGIVYVPLRLAYSTTTHKSQGLSLDKVQVSIRDPFFAQPGMLYVALSRARSVDGLRLVGTPEGFRARCTVNPKLRGYL